MTNAKSQTKPQENQSGIGEFLVSILISGAIAGVLLSLFLPGRQVRELDYAQLQSGAPAETDVCYNKGRPNYLIFQNPDGKKNGKHTRQIAGIRSSDPGVVHQAKHHKNGVEVKRLDTGRDVTLTVLMKDGTQYPVKAYVYPSTEEPKRHPALEGLVTGGLILLVIIWLCSLPIVII